MAGRSRGRGLDRGVCVCVCVVGDRASPAGAAGEKGKHTLSACLEIRSTVRC